jgi:ParB family transcriptional regulator, chromosome partitioning protein
MTPQIRLRTEILQLSPTEIHPDPDQPREEFDETSLAHLAKSLRVYGQLQPILIRRDGGRNVIVAGERRWRAAKMAGIATIQCMVCKNGDWRSLQLIENILRENLKPVEQAKAFQAIMKREGWSARTLASNLHIGHTQISRALKLLQADEPLQVAVDEGKVPATTAYEVVRAPKIEQPSLTQAVIAGEIKGDDLRRHPPAQRSVDRIKKAPKLAELKLGQKDEEAWRFSKGRISVVVTGHLHNHGLIVALQKALDAASDQKPGLQGGR